MNVAVEHAAGAAVLGLEQLLASPWNSARSPPMRICRNASASATPPTEHAVRRLRVLEPHQPGLGQRVDRDDLRAVAPLPSRVPTASAGGSCPGSGRRRGSGRRCRSRGAMTEPLPMPIVSVSADAATTRGTCSSSPAGCWCRTPGQQLVEERRLVRRAARGVERPPRPGSSSAAQLVGDQRERRVPGDRRVVRRARAQHHRVRQPALLTEPVVGRARSSSRPGGRRRTPASRVRVVASSATAFAPFSQNSACLRCPGVLRPRAARTVEAVALVQLRAVCAPCAAHPSVPARGAATPQPRELQRHKTSHG